MRFYIMRQDCSLSYCATFRDFDIKHGTHIFLKADSERLNGTTTLYLSGHGDEARPDFIQHPVYMISKKLHDILDAYEDDLVFKDVVLIHKETQEQYWYHQILMDQLDVRSSDTQYYPDGTEKKLVLDKEKIGPHHLFMVGDSRMRHPVVSLAVVESLLRRAVTGVLFEEVEVR